VIGSVRNFQNRRWQEYQLLTGENSNVVYFGGISFFNAAIYITYLTPLYQTLFNPSSFFYPMVAISLEQTSTIF
jgi:hypothetical protein